MILRYTLILKKYTILSQKLTYKDKELNIELKPVFKTLVENTYKLSQENANNRTLETSIKKGLESNSNPNSLNGSLGGTRTYNLSVNSRLLCH